jgi:hypothetical protein
MFSLALPVAMIGQQFDLRTAVLLPAYQVAGAVLVSVLVAWLVTSIARLTRRDEEHFRFALVVGAVMLTLGLSHSFNVSSLFAGLALGIACRWLQGRTRLTRVDFGGGGDVFFVILFVFAGANLHLKEVAQYAPIALAFVLVRTLAKVGVVYGCGVAFRESHRRSLATGLLLVPMAGLAIGCSRRSGRRSRHSRSGSLARQAVVCRRRHPRPRQLRPVLAASLKTGKRERRCGEVGRRALPVCSGPLDAVRLTRGAVRSATPPAPSGSPRP